MRYRYHHVLKSKWLDGKRNRRIDHLISTLVTELLPDIEHRLKRQVVLKPDKELSALRRRQILARAPEIPQDHITQVEDMRFQVQSSSRETHYDVDLVNDNCTCMDFPRIQFCKHIASVQHFFGGVTGGQLAPPPSPIPPVSHSTEQATECRNNVSSNTYDENTASLISVTNEIITLSQDLLTQMPKPDVLSNILKSLHIIRSHLGAVVTSAASDGPQLPEKEQIAPHQLSWPETATRMGVKRGKKSHGKVNSAHTAELIGEINRKRNREDEDPYGAGEQSGKRAKPDARSAAANARARASSHPPSSSLSAPLSSPRSTPISSSRPPLLPLSQPAPRPIHSFPPDLPSAHAPVPPQLPLSQPAQKPTGSIPSAYLPPHLLPRVPSPFPQAGPLLPLSQPAPRPARGPVPSASLPHLSSAQIPYYPPPFLSQPAQLTQYYYPGFPAPYYPYNPPNR